MGKKLIIRNVIIVISFLVSLYFVQRGIAGSSVVAQYNNGYGTFDMKQYDPIVVKNVLSQMDIKGISVYKWYYFFDFIFIIALGIFQCVVSKSVFIWFKIKNVNLIVCLIPFIRGLADCIENIIIFITLFTVPLVNERAILVASFATKIKLMMIQLWVLELLIGIIGVIIVRLRNKVANKGNK